MNPRNYTFDGPPKLPESVRQPTAFPESAKEIPIETSSDVAALIDIAEMEDGGFELVSRCFSITAC